MEPRNERRPMCYRRFGKTEARLSVITLGGMRYVNGWTSPRDFLPKETIAQCTESVQHAMALGINHFETAHGYVKSEHAYGYVLNTELGIPRNDYFLMTKGAPKDASDARKMVESQLQALQTDHLDFYAWHGINNRELFNSAVATGGPVEALLRMREEGLIGAVGFSTHGTRELVLDALNTDLFAFMNLHYYYFYQRLEPAVQLAADKDMGVFIISPNDKGGRLFDPPDLLREATAPWTPLQWNARFCLSTPRVHTLTFGMHEAAHFEQMRGIFEPRELWTAADKLVQDKLDAMLERDPYSLYEGHELADDPSGIIIPEVLRIRRLLKCYDMLGFGRYRYNMTGTQGHWYPGVKATDEALANVDRTRLPKEIDVVALLRETHQALNKERK
jgi:uncharacterized protein